MTNLQDYIISSRLFKTYKVDDLLLVQYTCLIGDQESTIWTHDNYFAFVMGGKKKWKTHSSEYLATDGDVLFVRKGAHSVYQYFEQEFHVLFIFLSDDFIANTVSKNLKTQPNDKMDNEKLRESIFPIPSTLILKTYFQSMLSYLTQEIGPDSNLLKIKIEELILNIFNQPGNQSLKHYMLTRKMKHRISIEEVMESQFASHLSINDFARMTARSLSAFRRDFKNIYHVTPGKWLLERRLVHARLLLETTSCAIGEIADQCGFRNQSHFIKVFKSNFGISPNSFRKTVLRVIEP